MDSAVETSGDFLLDYYRQNPDALFAIGDWETELACGKCGGAVEKSASCLFNQEFPTENTRRRNLALADARCPHCHVTGEIEKISGSLSIFHPIATTEKWFRRLTIDPPMRKVKTLFGFKEEPQEQRTLKEYRP